MLVDDHPLIREGLAEVLGRERDLTICGEAEDRQQALQLIPTTKPDLVIIDLALKKSHGLELMKDIRAQFPKVRMLVVSMQDERLNARRVIRAGASGYINKAEAADHVVQAVRKVLQGGDYFSPDVMIDIIKGPARPSQTNQHPGIEMLTDRELQVFELLGQGLARREIAERLNVTISTLETHRARIRDKLGYKNAQALLQAAIRYNHERNVGN